MQSRQENCQYTTPVAPAPGSLSAQPGDDLGARSGLRLPLLGHGDVASHVDCAEERIAGAGKHLEDRVAPDFQVRRLFEPELLDRCEWTLRRMAGPGYWPDEGELRYYLACLRGQAVFDVRHGARLKRRSQPFRKMAVQDAKGILTGGDTAGTKYFERVSRDIARL